MDLKVGVKLHKNYTWKLGIEIVHGNCGWSALGRLDAGKNSNGNTFSFILHVCYFPYHPWIAACEGRSLTKQEHQLLSPILLEFRHSSLLLFKNHKKPEIDKKIQACETLKLKRDLCIFLVHLLKTVSILLINFELVRALYSVGFLSNL